MEASASRNFCGVAKRLISIAHRDGVSTKLQAGVKVGLREDSVTAPVLGAVWFTLKASTSCANGHRQVLRMDLVTS